MFQEMRKKDREASRPETEAILARGMYGFLAMNGDDYAYGVPFSYVYRHNRIYLHCAREGKKLTHIRQDNRVSFCVVEEAAPLPDKFSMTYKSAMVFGKIYEVESDEEKMTGLVALVEKYYRGDEEHIARGKAKAADSLERTAVLRIEIDHLSGKIRKAKPLPPA
jgi:uncharacterized protein